MKIDKKKLFSIHGIDFIVFTNFIDTFEIWKTGEKNRFIA